MVLPKIAQVKTLQKRLISKTEEAVEKELPPRAASVGRIGAQNMGIHEDSYHGSMGYHGYIVEYDSMMLN